MITGPVYVNKYVNINFHIIGDQLPNGNRKEMSSPIMNYIFIPHSHKSSETDLEYCVLVGEITKIEDITNPF